MAFLIIGLLVSALCLLLAYSYWRHSFWSRKGVPVPPKCWPIFGHILNASLKKDKTMAYIDSIYRNHGGSTFCGFYNFLSATLIVGDPDLIKRIFIRDSDHFVDRTTIQFTNTPEDATLHDMMTIAQGSHWKGIRSVVSPVFTSGRLKGIFPLVSQKADDLVRYIRESAETANSSIELKKTFGGFIMETIASCAFGIDSNSVQYGESEFALKASELFSFKMKNLIKGLMFFIFPKVFQVLKIPIIQEEMHFFRNAINHAIKQRDTGFSRGDFLDLMMQARRATAAEGMQDPSSKAPKYPLTNDTIAAQSVLFILAGYETVSNTLSFAAFLLAKHPEIQKKLREELKGVLKETQDAELDYQGVMGAKYLDAVISETLRMYAPTTEIVRVCTKDYKLPGTEITIPKGINVIAPINCIHHDEKFWPEPKEFRPERFMPENKEEIQSGTYLPFGLGPRNCIGMRFALMEAKIAIAKIILEFEVSCVPGDEEIRVQKTPGLTSPEPDFCIVCTPLSPTN